MLSMKRRTFEMLCVCTKVWYTAMINGNCQNRTVVKHGMMFCCLLCATTGMLDFCLPWHFQSFCLSQSISVMDFQYWSVSLESRSWSWTSKSWSWSWNCWVLVLVLDKQVLNPSVVVGKRVGRVWTSDLVTMQVHDEFQLRIQNHSTWRRRLCFNFKVDRVRTLRVDCTRTIYVMKSVEWC